MVFNALLFFLLFYLFVYFFFFVFAELNDYCSSFNKLKKSLFSFIKKRACMHVIVVSILIPSDCNINAFIQHRFGITFISLFIKHILLVNFNCIILFIRTNDSLFHILKEEREKILILFF